MVIGYPFALTSGTDGQVTEAAMIVSIMNRDDLNKYKGKLEDKIILVTPKREFALREMTDAVRHDEETLAAYRDEGIDLNMKKRRATAWYKRYPRPEGITPEEIEAFYKSEGVAVVLY